MLPIFITNRTDAFVLQFMFLVWITTEVMWSRSRRPSGTAEIKDRLSGTGVILGIWLGILTAYLAAYTAPRFAIRWQRTLFFDVGIALMAAGMALRWYSIHVLGKYFTVVVAIQPGQTIISNGPYHFLRHPSYSGALLTILGFGLALTNWLSILAALFFAAIGYSYRIAVEERTLLASLGDPYREYMKRTKRIIPFVI